jgi:hypothetical protein
MCTSKNIMVSILNRKHVQEVCIVLALVEGERKVSFGEAWRALQSNGVRTYAVWCMKLMKGNNDKEGKSDTAHTLR